MLVKHFKLLKAHTQQRDRFQNAVQEIQLRTQCMANFENAYLAPAALKKSNPVQP